MTDKETGAEVEENTNPDGTVQPSSENQLAKKDGTVSAAKKGELQQFQLHIPPPKPQKVLEEDEYVEAVSNIIERDFFPSLKKLRLQNEFLDAVASENTDKARTIGSHLAKLTGRVSSGKGTPYVTPLGGETPIIVPFTSSNPAATPVSAISTTQHNPSELETNVPDMTLDKFQRLHTSEDNASFHTVIQRSNEDRKRKYSWIYDKESNKLVLSGEDAEIATQEPKLREGEPRRLEFWNSNAKNQLMYYPEGAPLTLADVAEERKAPPSIQHKATRFVSSTSTTTQKVLDLGSEAAGRLQTQQIWSQMTAATPALFPRPIDEIGTPISGVGGTYRFVASTPSPAPHRDIDPEDLMTWGTIEDVVLLDDLPEPDDSGRSFTLAPTERREEVARKLSDKATKSIAAKNRDQTDKYGRASAWSGSSGKVTPLLSPSPRAGSQTPRVGSGSTSKGQQRSTPRMLSPAAKHLLERSAKLRGSNPDGFGAVGGSRLRSPSPLVFSGSGGQAASKGNMGPPPPKLHK
ncbi:nuclear protein Es2-domain-containing protein [Cladochytrium replicatum]|nr:nuclear protein Es2-domain-containing protein [Cladochytrium replicatum]